ncbi:hypothetical protein AMS68_002323 [Peltaster fructicola]|uniref:Geranylgeranyl transferase type-2 subunit alpha n=1 Tax=Peltaster fructicola TaxID=286661 RepID=A0A6H0XQ38_9PEZI|nr:hypothetical protein AMS68_002323 [Peltaster fructicola]
MASHGVPRATVVDKSEAAKARERKQIADYRNLEDDARRRISSRDLSSDTFGITTALLRQNPEYYTIWNYRRVILQDILAKDLAILGEESTQEQDRLAAEKEGLTLQQREISLIIKEDLQFLVPLLRQFPKCYWIWNHRAWLLNEATERLPTATALMFWQGELGLVTKMLGLDSRNFHGWDYRRKCITELERLSGQSMVLSEFEYTTKMIKSNLSNFSAWHNRSQLIPRLLRNLDADSGTRRKLFEEEFELITTALYTDPYDQSLWFYHQYLMSTLDEGSPTNHQQYARDTSILSNVTNEDRMHYLDQELDSIKDMLDDAEDCKYIYQALLEYAASYMQIEAGNKKLSTQQLRAWLDELMKLDPLREGRWHDLEKKLML